jgi:L-alanine-DL-glutamate epimerase-like enolase superfamily enzyme
MSTASLSSPTEPPPTKRPDIRITEIELWPQSSPFRRPFSMRQETLATIDSVLIRIHTDAGITGIADTGNTSPWFQGETQGSIIALIADVFGPQVLLGQDPRNIEQIVARMDVLARDNNQAKMLVDCALHDLKGKLLGVPVYDLLGGRTVESSLQGFAMSAGEPTAAAALAERAVAAGYTTLKLKTGHGSDDDDIKLVAAVREAVGDGIDLFIDINGRWRYDEAVRMLRRLEPYQLAFVEQPLAPGDVEGLVRLRGRVGTPIYADESARDPSDVQLLISRGAVDGLFFKLSKAGGYVKGQRWLAIAQSAGIPVKCGCMIGCGLEASAYTHLTVSHGWLSRFTHENVGPLLIHDVFDTVSEPIQDDIALNVPRYERARAYPTEGPGLGIEIDADDLPSRLTRDKTSVTVS